MVLSRTLIAEHAVVASEQPLASMAGYDILKRGGNAFDAAVATGFALGVTYHPAGGIGGDFFGMLYDAKADRVHCINSSGWAPSGVGPGLLASKGYETVPTYGPVSCVVPGFVAGIHAMHERLGALPFAGLLGQAEEYARHGFPAGDSLCRSTAATMEHFSPDTMKVFAPSGSAPVPGEWMRQDALADTIAEVAKGGPEAFYKGWPAESICEELNHLGVPAKLSDFDFKPEWPAPITLDYRGTVVYEHPPNSMGATSLLILRILMDHEMKKTRPLSNERMTATMEAVEVAYRRRDEELGDPRFGKFDLAHFLRQEVAPGSPTKKLVGGDTTAFSVTDSDGNIVSGIQSLFNHWGSRVFIPKAGLMLNNRGAGFNTKGPNVIGPRKRPLHTLSSLLLSKEGRPTIGIGASGGEFRPLQHALFVTNIVDYGMSVENAVDHPRFLWRGGRSMIAEQGYEQMGSDRYDMEQLPFPGRTGVSQAVEASGRYRKGVCDIRGDGIPAGF